MSIPAGQLRDKVRIEQLVAPGTSPDEYNSGPETYSGSTTRRCSIEPLTGKEYFAAEGENSSVSVKVRVRYERGLYFSTTRLVDVGKSPEEFLYVVVPPIDPGNEHSELILMCEIRGKQS